MVSKEESAAKSREAEKAVTASKDRASSFKMPLQVGSPWEQPLLIPIDEFGQSIAVLLYY